MPGHRATAAFDIQSWEETAWDEQGGGRLTRTRVTKTFRGDLEGNSTAELSMAYAAEGPRAYLGFERIVGSLKGRTGSFVLQHVASATSEGQSAEWSIVPDCGTGALSGIRGTAQIGVEPGGGHTLTLEYDLD